MNFSTIKRFSQEQVTRETQFAPIGNVVKDFEGSPSTAHTPKNLSAKGSFFADEKEVHQKLGQRFNRTTISGASYSVALNEYLVAVDNLVLAPTIGLPRPRLAGVGKTYIVKDEIGGAASTTITIVSQGEELIDGASSKTMTNNYEALEFYTDGANWFIF